MKRFFAFLTVLAMMLSLCCVSVAEDEVLVIYSARNERLNNIVIPAFEAATGIKVEMITGSSGEVLQRVKSEVETGNVTVDIHWAADETMLAANRDLADFDGSFLLHDPYPQTLSEAPAYFADYLPHHVTPLPREAWPEVYRTQAKRYGSRPAVGYCNTCVRGAREGGAEAYHLAELLFPVATDQEHEA